MYHPVMLEGRFAPELWKSERKKEHDFAVNAFRVIQEATGQVKAKLGKKEAFDAGTLGLRGGAKGGRARAEKLTPEQRKAIAQKAARSGWLLK